VHLILGRVNRAPSPLSLLQRLAAVESPYCKADIRAKSINFLPFMKGECWVRSYKMFSNQMKIAFKCARGSGGWRYAHQKPSVALLRSGKGQCLCDGATWLKCNLRGCLTWAYNEHICEQYAIWWVQAGQSAASPRSVPKPCFTVVASAAGVAFPDSARLHLLRFGTICSSHLKHSGNYRLKQVQDVWDQDLEENIGTGREEVTPEWREFM